MGIGWLWHFTLSGSDTVGLRAANERRSAALYRRWRSVLAIPSALAERRRESRRRRAGRRELETLSDRLLRDVGRRRDGAGRVTFDPNPAPPRPRRSVPALGSGPSSRTPSTRATPTSRRTRDSRDPGSASSARTRARASRAGAGAVRRLDTLGRGRSPESPPSVERRRRGGFRDDRTGRVADEARPSPILAPTGVRARRRRRRRRNRRRTNRARHSR